ncbi:non-ribosomal peptide synthetase [Brevibacillus laterosporus]|uniref:non-ribosomal peptide synthetase n=1 Tax=Brevibacillus laterosporus TaxID=1465 RepID=UPI0018CF0D90|nr:non-ribosomal peptide synthetase [Brevibacillus laterosporus]MBG9799437.1 peptide ligase [Brevibacillus laterosporus]MCR8937152.1 non-ribosomal peptide synthetase [Brevibacillus laterosporus]MCZ0839790.1 non-ribosomal peptide synthetase [Brevibacillus laterosporus]MCZ0847442.1 non-ribosomal peptide synthetase [Brevibacillus laterosporus]MED1913591.1 non-ribosomal peptide synthetase [Brevibacillus laterosporus]
MSEKLSNAKDLFPMSDIQLGMVYHSLKHVHEAVYHDQFVYQVDDDSFDVHVLEQAMRMMVDKHDILKTSFHIEEFSTPVQVVHQDVSVQIDEIDITHLEEQQKEHIHRYLAEDRLSPFDVTTAPLWRMRVFKLNSKQIALVWIFHHAILDGWSVASFITELIDVYFKLKQKKLILEPLQTTYKDYVIDQMLLSEQNELREFWIDELKDYKRLQLPVKMDENGGTHVTVVEKLDPDIINKCREIAQAHHIPLKTVCLTAFLSMMHMISYERDLTVGLIENNRPITEDAEKVLGCFLNSVPFRAIIKKDMSWKELLEQTQQKLVEIKTYGRLSFAKIIEVIGETGSERNPVFDCLFNFVDFHVFKGIKDHKVKFWLDGYEKTNTMFDFSVSTTMDDYFVRVVSALPKEDTVKLIKYYQRILEKIALQIDEKIDKRYILDEQESHLLVEEWNQTIIDYPDKQTLHKRFEEQVEKYADHVALVFEEKQLTYGELNAKANQLARVLQKHNTLPNQVIGLITERSLEMIIGVLGILKAGGAYMPIDPTYPSERINYMLEDSRTYLLLVQKADMIPVDYQGEVFILTEALWEGETTENLELVNQPQDVANVMYTSGTTGKPKGILITHRNIMTTIINNGYIDIFSTDRILQVSNYAFDGSTFDIYSALLNGATLVLVPMPTLMNTADLLAIMRDSSITVCLLTTSLFNTLVDLDVTSFKNMRKVLFGGEKASFYHVEKALDYLGEGRLVNSYGPTETTVFATSYTVDHTIKKLGSVPIGRPFSNTSVYIFGLDDQLQPLGAPGELCVAGESISLGYLNRPDLTAEKFVDNPLKPGERMYRTGDLVRWLPEGVMEYMGRIDEQVKIRGHRIELGEIEAKLLEHPSIRETVLVAKQDARGHSFLGAYLVTDNFCPVTELRNYLMEILPEYMVPSYFIELDSLPLTSNGKVDKRALPEPESQALQAYTMPENETEEKLVQLFQEVMDVELVGTQDSFYELGGHSLKAMMLVSRIHKDFGVKVPLKEVFSRPTVKELAAYLTQSEEANYIEIEAAEKKTYYPVTAAQKRMYIAQQWEADEATSSYHMPFMMEITGPLQVDKLQQILKSLVERHEALRTSFHMIDEVLMQKIHADVLWDLDIDIEPVVAVEQEIEDKMFQFLRKFDLSEASLFRAKLLRVNANQHVLLLDMHHIISDGFSYQIFFEELTKLYQGEELPPLKIQYKDYAVWQHSEEQRKRLQQQEEYWLRQFQSEIPVLELPTDYQRPVDKQFAGALFTYELSVDITEKLRKLAIREKTTLYTVLLTVYNVLLTKYTSQEDIIVGTPIAGRPHADLDRVFGMFVNTLAIRTTPKVDYSFLEYLSEVKETVLGAYQNPDYPFEELVERTLVQRDISRNPLFDVMFSVEKLPSAVQFDELRFCPRLFDWKKAKFDLDWTVVEGESLQVLVEYSTSLFDRLTVERMSKHFEHILEQIIEHPKLSISDIELLTEAEKQQILIEFNQSDKYFDRQKTIQEQFEEWVDKTPDSMALVFKDKQLTYQELNQRANQVAHLLRANGISANDFIGLMVDRSLEMIISMLGILKAGGAYLPIDPDYPEDRIDYMLSDSKAKILLKQSEQTAPASFEGKVISIDTPELLEMDVENVSRVNSSSDLAYIIYTSGSTGKPKGVLINHRCVINMQLTAETFGISPSSRVLQFASFSFDSSVGEIFYTLLNGACLYLVEKDLLLSGNEFVLWLKKNKISSIPFISPSALRMLPYEHLPDLAYISTGGEALPADLVKAWGENRIFLNAYGPTETTVDATVGICTPEGKPHIGRPVKNKKVYVVNSSNQLQPIGVPGELCISGEGVALGYLNRPDLTQEKFVSNPFIPGERMYRSGDLVRWLPDGTIEYYGRLDDQVKIRGHRIELGEIETRLLEHPSIKEAIVIPRSDESEATYLCSYLIVEGLWNAADMRKYLKASLPDYMIPSYFVELQELPLTPNGKIDKKALPKPEKQMHRGQDYVAPTNLAQSILSQIWSDVLGNENIGIHDNFFELGGDSIKAIQISARLNKYNLKVKMRELFKNPTIAELSLLVQEIVQEIDQGVVEGNIPLTPIQHWFFSQTFPQVNHYNQSILLYNAEGWDDQKVDKAFEILTQHHDALRMVYSLDSHEVVQRNRGLDGSNYHFEIIDVRQDGDDQSKWKTEANRIQANMDIAQGPLVQIGLFRTNEGDYLLIAIHHLVVDGVSWRILLEDFYHLYRGNDSLPLKTTSFQAWSQKLQEYVQSKELEKELPYWRNLDETIMDYTLIKDIEIASSSKATYEEFLTVSMSLSTEETQQLVTEAHKAYQTEMNDLLLTALALALKEWTNKEQLLVSMEGHGREEILENVDISRTIGWFTSEYPVAIHLTKTDISFAIKQVKETLRRVPNKGFGFGVLKYLAKETFEVKPEISFNYLGQFTDKEEGNSSLMGDLISRENTSELSLDINGSIEADRLQMHFSYNASAYYPETIASLVQNFKSYLLEIISHCLTKDGVEHTPSDFDINDLTMEELDDIFDDLEEEVYK